MLDLVYVAVVVAFFVVAAAYVVACDRIIGPDEDDGIGAGRPKYTTDPHRHGYVHHR